MNLTIAITDLIEKSRQFPVGFMEKCLASGKELNGVLTITVEDYDKAKQRPVKPESTSTPTKANGCCGGKPK